MAKYQKIRTCGPKLRVAFQCHLVSLPDLLLAEHLITDDNVSELKTTAQTEPVRASRMLEFIRNKVKVNDGNYDVFVEALQKDAQYSDILIILGEKCPQPKGSPAAAPAPATSKLEVNLPDGHFVENDVIQSHYSKLALIICDNLDQFGTSLVNCKCFSAGSVTDITDTLGMSPYKKATKLLKIVNSRIETATSKKNARKIFDCLVVIMGKDLHHPIGQALVITYQSKDPSYINPLPSVECAQASCITPDQDTQKPKDGMVVPGSKAISTPEKPAEGYPTQVENSNATSKISGQPESIAPPKGPCDTSEKLQIAVSENHGPIQEKQGISPSRSTSVASTTQASQESEEQNDAGPTQATSESSTMQNRIESDTGPPNETTPEKEAAIASPPSQPGAGAGAESCVGMQKKLEYLNLAGSKPKIAFCDSMSEEDFLEYLKVEGLCRKDRKTIEDKGITPVVFAHHFEQGLTELEFTFGGKIILQALHKKIGQ